MNEDEFFKFKMDLLLYGSGAVKITSEGFEYISVMDVHISEEKSLEEYEKIRGNK